MSPPPYLLRRYENTLTRFANDKTNIVNEFARLSQPRMTGVITDPRYRRVMSLAKLLVTWIECYIKYSGMNMKVAK